MSEGHAGESSPAVLTRDCTRSALPIPSQEGRSVTVHEFLRGITGKAGRKYGRRNRRARVNPGSAYRRRGPTPTRAPGHAETPNGDQRGISAHHPRIIQPNQKHHLFSRRVPHPRRKKIFAKSLAQRLFEADVFSSGTSKSSRPTSAQDHARASTSTNAGARRPLQFVTSLNLTPSLESRIYPKKWHRGGEAAGSDVDITMRTVPDPACARNASAPDHLAVAAASGVASWSGAATGHGSDARTAHTRRSAAAVLPSGRKTALRARGGRQSAVQIPPSPFQYVALPLVHVNTPRGAVQAPSGVHPIALARTCQTNINCCPLAPPSSLHHGWSDIARRP
jgi:hypothetical protein